MRPPGQRLIAINQWSRSENCLDRPGCCRGQRIYWPTSIILWSLIYQLLWFVTAAIGDSGPPATRWQRQSKSKYLLFLNSDCQIHGWFIEYARIGVQWARDHQACRNRWNTAFNPVGRGPILLSLFSPGLDNYWFKALGLDQYFKEKVPPEICLWSEHKAVRESGSDYGGFFFSKTIHFWRSRRFWWRFFRNILKKFDFKLRAKKAGYKSVFLADMPMHIMLVGHNAKILRGNEPGLFLKSRILIRLQTLSKNGEDFSCIYNSLVERSRAIALATLSCSFTDIRRTISAYAMVCCLSLNWSLTDPKSAWWNNRESWSTNFDKVWFMKVPVLGNRSFQFVP